MRIGYLGLGSNVGDRAGHLRAAVELLSENGVEVEAVSSTYETEPVGEMLDQPDFLNAAVRIRTDLELSTERLTLPHREATTRRFVLAPLLELDPELALPDGTSLAGAHAALAPGQRAERVGSL